MLESTKGTVTKGVSVSWSFEFIPPTVMMPPLELRQRENWRCSPVNLECLATIWSKRSDYLLGANPKIPLAYWVKKRLVYFVVQPKYVLIYYPWE